jgi:hypothetical protein
VSVIDVYPNGKFARPREKESFLMKKINSAQAGEILVPDNN